MSTSLIPKSNYASTLVIRTRLDNTVDINIQKPQGNQDTQGDQKKILLLAISQISTRKNADGITNNEFRCDEEKRFTIPPRTTPYRKKAFLLKQSKSVFESYCASKFESSKSRKQIEKDSSCSKEALNSAKTYTEKAILQAPINLGDALKNFNFQSSGTKMKGDLFRCICELNEIYRKHKFLKDNVEKSRNMAIFHKKWEVFFGKQWSDPHKD